MHPAGPRKLSEPALRLDRIGPDELASLRDKFIAKLRGSTSLQDAAQRFAIEIFERFSGSVALSRVYATVPNDQLPSAERLTQRGLSGETLVLSLLGTHGHDSSWNNRARSKNHLAIPLINAQRVEEIPMIARLLQELGFDLSLLEVGEGVIARKLIGGFNGVFYVADAATAVDAKGRLIIPAQDFVASNGIKTVFGMGGCYLSGTTIAVIVFARQTVPRRTAEMLATLVSVLKMATEELVTKRRIYV
jgi:hypothetical protein